MYTSVMCSNIRDTTDSASLELLVIIDKEKTVKNTLYRNAQFNYTTLRSRTEIRSPPLSCQPCYMSEMTSRFATRDGKQLSISSRSGSTVNFAQIISFGRFEQYNNSPRFSRKTIKASVQKKQTVLKKQLQESVTRVQKVSFIVHSCLKLCLCVSFCTLGSILDPVTSVTI